MQVSKWIRIFLAIIGSILFLDGLFLAFLNKIHVGTIVPLILGHFSASMPYFIIIWNVFLLSLSPAFSLAFRMVMFLDLVDWLRLFLVLLKTIKIQAKIFPR